MEPIKTIEWIADQPKRLVPGMIRLVDQTRLPSERGNGRQWGGNGVTSQGPVAQIGIQ